MKSLSLRVLAAGLLFLSFALIPASTPAAAASLKVTRVQFAVTLPDNSPAQITGYLYCHGSCEQKVLQVLVHGGTYDHRYWDGPVVNGVDYSYSNYMAEQHYAVLALDQLGAGESTHPEGDLVTLDSWGAALHQVLQSLHAPENPTGATFRHIVLVGHSFGSITSIYVLGAHPEDADALVTTGAAHVPSAPPPSLLAVIGQLEASDYSFLPDAVRASVFYYAAGADPDVIAYDNAHLANPIARGFLNSVFPVQFNDAANHVGLVQGPVLVQLGEFDALAPAVPAAAEAAHWTTSDLTVQTLAGVGHDVNLHLAHEQSWTAIADWLEAHVSR